MKRYLALQAVGLIATLLIASFVVYASMFVAPGSPESVLFGNHTVDPAVRAAVEAKYHLNDPFLQRYVEWLGQAVHGDFGISLAYRQPVSERIAAAAPTTLLLVAYASVLILIAGISLGVLGALRPGRVDALVTGVTTLGVAVPSFVAGTVLISLFAVDLGLFPVFGPGSGLLDRLWHLTLPAFALAFWASALLARVTRSSMRAELRSEHVETARSRGLPERVVVRRHVLRNALVPIATVAGLEVAGLISGTVVVEQVFGLQGLGQLLVTSVNQKDFPTVQSVCLIMVTAFVLVNVVVDVLYTVLDPRIRLGESPA